MLLLLLFNVIFAGQVKISPEVVNVQSQFNIEYEAEDYFIEQITNSTPFLTLYLFDNNHSLPKAIDIQGEKIGDVYKYCLNIDTLYNFAMFKFSDGISDDNNHQEYWDIVLHKYDKVIEGGYLKKALSYLGSFPQNIDRLPDLKVAETFIKKELELYPDNIVAQIALVQVRFDQGFLKEDAYKDELKDILNKKIDLSSEQNVRAVARGLKTIGVNEKAEEIELEFGKKYPKTELAHELIMAKLSEAENLKSFVDICEFLIKNYEDSSQKEKLMLALVNAYLQNGNYFALKKKLEEFEFIYPSVYSKIGMELSELNQTRNGLSGMDLKREVIANYRKSITLIDSMISAESTLGQPRYFSRSEQLNYNTLLSGTLRQGLGEFYLEMRDLDSADFFLRNAKIILKNNAETSLYLSLIELNKLNTNTKEVINIAEEAILNSSYNDTIVNLYKSLKDENTLDSLFKVGQDLRISKLKQYELNYKTFSGLFKTTEDLYKDIESDTTYKIVTFFSTWCAPCQAMVPALENIEGVISDSSKSKEVSLYSINAWENPEQRNQLIAEFLDEYKPKYDILIDETSIIPQKYGVTGLPVTLILDKDSKIKFKIDGFDNEADYIKKCLDRIEYLKINNK